MTQKDWAPLTDCRKSPKRKLGNHDLLLDLDFVDRFPERILERPGSRRIDLQWGDVKYLQNELHTAIFPTQARTLNVYGSPWTQQFGNWSFQYPPIRDVFARQIPENTDILLVHGPPKFHLDNANNNADNNNNGCEHLLREIWRVHQSLKMVVFGHIHAGYGSVVLPFNKAQKSYERVLHRKHRFPAILALAFWVLWEYLKQMNWMVGMFSNSNNDRVQAIRLVNAAIACGPGNEESRSPLVFQI